MSQYKSGPLPYLAAMGDSESIRGPDQHVNAASWIARLVQPVTAANANVNGTIGGIDKMRMRYWHLGFCRDRFGSNPALVFRGWGQT